MVEWGTGLQDEETPWRYRAGAGRQKDRGGGIRRNRGEVEGSSDRTLRRPKEEQVPVLARSTSEISMRRWHFNASIQRLLYPTNPHYNSYPFLLSLPILRGLCTPPGNLPRSQIHPYVHRFNASRAQSDSHSIQTRNTIPPSDPSPFYLNST